MIGLDEARAQADALEVAAKGSVVRQYRYELRARAGEWQRAVRELEDVADEACIELVGAVGAGMAVYEPTTQGGWCRHVRTMTRDGQVSFHLEDPDDPRPVYRNYFASSSPAVVKL